MNELLAGAMAAFVYLTQVEGVTGEVFEYNSLPCSTSHRQGDDVLIGCGSLQSTAKPAASLSSSSPLAAFRNRYPEYNDMSDAALADALYRKFYSDMPREQFDAKLGELSAAVRKPPVLKGVMHFGQSIQEQEPVNGNEEPWSVALRLLPGMRCSQWQGKYWKCHTGERPPLPPDFVPLGDTQ